ncbi:MAG: tetratricopeptide repeat protein [Bacteroidetes bacterium]|nr:tetratricopeptide repeat protein [Bacteroidota bacterium]
MESDSNKYWKRMIKRIWPVIVSLSGAVVMILAFFIPSLQEQWDRYQARKVIQEYEQLGDEFMDEDRYQMAEEAYAKAFELSELKRLDIEMKRLNARVNRIHENPEWDSELPDDLKEVDFQYLLHLQKKKNLTDDRFHTLNSYGIYLAAFDRYEEAHKAFDEALALRPNDALTWVNLGNLYDQERNLEQAQNAYKKALALEPDNPRAHYNLGLLYAAEHLKEEARSEFEKVLKLDPADSDAVEQLRLLGER